MEKIINNECLICNSSDMDQLIHIDKFPLFFGAIPYDKKKSIEEFPLTITQCINCRHVQQFYLVDEKIMNRVYDAEYYNCPSPVSTGMGKREIEKFLSFFNENNLKKGKLLEIACFDGFLLEKIQNKNWDVYGCDPSSMTTIAEELIGKEKIKKKYFNKGLYAKGIFDCIVFRNLLEHIYDLHEFLRSISYSLKDGGRIFIDVPNLKTYESLGGFGMFFHQHISYFSIDSLRILLSLHGFKIEREYNGNPNLFVQALKSGQSKTIDELHNINSIKKINTLQKNQIKLIKKIKLFFSNNKKIALFGASALATSLISILDKKQMKKIAAVFDNDNDKIDKELHGLNLPISTLSNSNLQDYDSILITTYFFDKEIQKQLIKNKYPKEKIVSINDFVIKQ